MRIKIDLNKFSYFGDYNFIYNVKLYNFGRSDGFAYIGQYSKTIDINFVFCIYKQNISSNYRKYRGTIITNYANNIYFICA